MKGFWILRGLKFLVFGALFVIAFGWVTMFTWNYVMPSLFHLPVITYWQGIALLVLARLLFWRGGGWHHKGHRGWHGHQWKGMEFKERFSQMSPEERERVKQYWKYRCGYRKKNEENTTTDTNTTAETPGQA
jgi:hypothetical protein